jgi:hypothetical protein
MLKGWTEQPPQEELRVWRDEAGAVLSFLDARGSIDLAELADAGGVQQWARSVAESAAAGLIEARVADTALGPAASLIYKRRDGAGYVFTGMLLLAGPEHIWTVVAGEHGMTGVREAVVTAQLMTAGTLTIRTYEESWAQDPYDPAYSGVDRSVLRFVSDDACYDGLFPAHPLSNIRAILAALPDGVKIEPGPAKA